MMCPHNLHYVHYNILLTHNRCDWILSSMGFLHSPLHSTSIKRPSKRINYAQQAILCVCLCVFDAFLLLLLLLLLLLFFSLLVYSCPPIFKTRRPLLLLYLLCMCCVCVYMGKCTTTTQYPTLDTVLLAGKRVQLYSLLHITTNNNNKHGGQYESPASLFDYHFVVVLLLLVVFDTNHFELYCDVADVLTVILLQLLILCSILCLNLTCVCHDQVCKSTLQWSFICDTIKFKP